MSDTKHGGIKIIEPAEKLTEGGFLCKKWDGRVYPPFIDPADVQRMISAWDTDEHDIFICTHQKVGTHLTKKFVVELLRSLVEYPAEFAINTGDIGHGTIPWPEVMVSQHGYDSLLNHLNKTAGYPRAWYSHFSAEDMPFRTIHPKTKFLTVIRDPKSAAVSQYFFYQSHPLLEMPKGMSMDDFVDLFLEGNLYFGDYHHFVLQWISGCSGRIDPKNLLVLRYEDMVEQKIDTTRNIARFLFPEREPEDKVIQAVADSTDFQKMKKDITENPRSFHFNPNTFFRSGKTNDWENHLSEYAIRAIDEKTRKLWAGKIFAHLPADILSPYL